MTIWNVLIPVIELVEAETEAEALSSLITRLERAGFDATSFTEGRSAFESEDPGPGALMMPDLIQVWDCDHAVTPAEAVAGLMRSLTFTPGPDPSPAATRESQVSTCDETAVIDLGTTEVVLTAFGFYARCKACPWVSEFTPSRFKARETAAMGHGCWAR